ncbi:MAG: PD40 domain-containing protein [Candidatus Aminicenantes bacterium]|nr:MAG: PD40 domain-containing protein [Candidatus Aminicenantes bacterium]
MRHVRIFSIGVLVIAAFLTGCTDQDDSPVLTGPYLGQDPPGMTPEIFASGILSAGYSEIKAVFSPDGKEIYYQLWGEPFPVIVMMKEKSGRWTKPEVAPFSGQIIEGYNISPDGKRMFVASQRPLSGHAEQSEDYRVWVTEKNEKGWGELKVLKPSIIGYPAVAENGNLYLATGDIWISEFVNGDYTEMKKLDDSINTSEFYEEDLYIAPDESYLLFCRRDDGFGSWDIFVSFRREDGTWTIAQNMGNKINSSVSEVYPFVTPDGKYLFFSSRRTIHESFSPVPITYEEKIKILKSPGNGNADIYWVDAKIIENLKPKELK